MESPQDGDAKGKARTGLCKVSKTKTNRTTYYGAKEKGARLGVVILTWKIIATYEVAGYHVGCIGGKIIEIFTFPKKYQLLQYLENTIPTRTVIKMKIEHLGDSWD